MVRKYVRIYMRICENYIWDKYIKYIEIPMRTDIEYIQVYMRVYMRKYVGNIQ